MNDLNPSRKLAARPRAGCFLALLAMAGLLFTVTQVHAQNPPTYYLQIDSSAVPGGLFQPIFVALDNSNDVYVTDTYSRVVKFDRNGNYLTQWGSYGSGNGQFDGPDGIAVDSSNNIYVIDSGNARIEKFDRNGNYLTHWGSLGGGKGLAGIAVDSSNNVYVVDSSNSRIEKFDSNGNYLTQWGSQGSGNGQFDYPNGIAVDSSNNVYVGDSYNNRIEKFTSSGTYLAQWGSIGRGNGQFQAPVGIAVDNSNNVYVTDFNNDRVEKFDNNGNYLTQWGSEGTGNGQFETPQGVAVDSSGNFIYVVDNGNLRIQVFVNNANIVPAIITQEPTNQTVPFGANVTFSVGVVGAAPFAYQWSSNSIAISSATNATFTLTNVSFANSGGTYSVLVSNIYGSVLSSNAVLTVLPTLVTTQPASGLSATGAVLNGSIILGSDETVAWFEWGTDTNYGNISGDIIVPGDNGSNSISAALTGLPGNFYHYRLDASNDFEFVYGQDQSFTVGFAPSATTLPPTNGATLEAVVNPEGWDTTVYFQWETPTLTNTTPGIEIGAGAASVNVSSFVPGLSASTTYQYQVVASNALGTAFGAVAWDPNQNHYLFSGSKTNITLRPGTYIITAYGAPSGGSYDGYGGLGAEMSAEFNFSTSTTLTLLVGGGGGGGSFAVNGSTPLVIAGGSGGESLADISRPGGNGTVSTNGEGDLYGGFGGTNGGGGGGGEGEGGGGGGGGFLGNGGSDSEGGGGGSSFENGGGGGYYGIEGSDYGGGYGGGGGSGFYTDGYYGGGGGGGYSGGGGAGFSSGGGGSIIDSSAIAIFTEISGIASPEDPANGEIIITAVPTPLAIITTNTAFGFTDGVFGFDVSGPSGSNVVIQASTDLQTWMPLQTNLLGSGLLYFSDAQSTTNVQRFYRAQLSPAFTVGGTLTGLPAGDTVTLHNGSDNLTLSANGTFTFPTALPNGQSYSVTVSGTGGGIPTSCTLANGSGNISGANVTNVAVQSTYPALTGIMDVDMYNAAVWDGTAHGGIPGIMFTENGGPFRVTAEGPYSVAVAKTYYGWAVFTHVVGTYSCSSTTLTNGGYVIQFGTVQNCGSPPRY